MEDAHVGVADVCAHYGIEYCAGCGVNGGGQGEQASTASRASTAGLAFFGVFDGHGGPGAARFASERLLDLIVAHPGLGTRPGSALAAAFDALDHEFYDRVVVARSAPDSGSTALAALVTGDRLVIANAGDSRAVLCRGGRPLALSVDHKPGAAGEAARIAAAGGRVCPDGFLNASLGVARAIGDYEGDGLKSLGADGRLVGPLTAAPDVSTSQLTPDDEFLVVACDGLWDVVSSARAVELARGALAAANDPAAAAAFLVRAALDLHASDNVTALVVCFGADPPSRRPRGVAEGGGAAAAVPPRPRPPRSLSRGSLSTLSNALASCAPARPAGASAAVATAGGSSAERAGRRPGVAAASVLPPLPPLDAGRNGSDGG
jgi:protein phosphatase 2C family protein 2/3